MHLHHGDVPAHVGGHIMVTIAGKGDLEDCISFRPVGGGDLTLDVKSPPGFVPGPGAKQAIYDAVSGAELEYVICHPDCLSEKEGYATACIPDCGKLMICGVLAAAKSCEGGCNGDERGSGGVPSRACDLGREDLPDEARQNVWIQGKNSDERSGNPSDADYSRHSIYKYGNYGNWCSEKIDYLKELWAEGDASYVALHTNPHATGSADYDFGTVLAPINDGSGVSFRDKDGNAVAVPQRT